MGAQEVTKLRKSGELKNAYLLAKRLLKQEPANIWNRRAMAWVQHDLLNNAIEREENDSVIKVLNNIQRLELPEDEEIFYEQVAWKVGKHLFHCKAIENPSMNSINFHVNKVFQKINAFPFPKPAESYSFLFKSLHRHYKGTAGYLSLIDWWGFDNFMSQDYQKDELENGNQVLSIVEKAYGSYAKCLLESDSVEKQKIDNFLRDLGVIAKNHPEYQYTDYYQAKLLLKLGKREQAHKAILPFARTKSTESWVWEVLAETVSESEKEVACLCKAIVSGSGPEYIMKARKHLAKLLISRDQFQEAKTEINEMVQTRESNGWDIPDDIKTWQHSEWFGNTEALKNNEQLYNQYVSKAEKILFESLPTTKVVVEYVNEEKSILNFIDAERNTGFFNYSNHLDEVSIGDVLDVRFNKKDGDYHTVHTVEKSSQKPENLVKSISGICNIIEDKGFGFIDDIFIPNQIIDQYNLSDQEEISGKAIPSFDKKKDKWGWQVAIIERE